MKNVPTPTQGIRTKVLILVFAGTLAMQASAQSPEQLWKQVPRAADSTSVCKTDSVKVGQYFAALDGAVRRIDGMIASIRDEAKKLEPAAKAEVAAMQSKSSVSNPLNMSKTEIAALQNMTNEQQQAAVSAKMKAKSGMSLEEMAAMAKKMETASEEEQMSMAMQMAGAASKVGGGVKSTPMNATQLRVHELTTQIAEGNAELFRRASEAAQAADKNRAQIYQQTVRPAWVEFDRKMHIEEPQDYTGMNEEPMRKSLQAKRMRHFPAYCNAVSPALSKSAGEYEAAHNLELQLWRNTQDKYDEIARIDPTAIHKGEAMGHQIVGLEIVQKYAKSLKYRYGAFEVLGYTIPDARDWRLIYMK